MINNYRIYAFAYIRFFGLKSNENIDMNHEHTHEELHKHHKEHYDDHAGIHSREMWEDMI